jgi:hypothetical protein
VPKLVQKALRSGEGNGIRGDRSRLTESARVVQAIINLPNLTTITQEKEVGWALPTPTPGLIIIAVVGNELPGENLEAGCTPKTKN